MFTEILYDHQEAIASLVVMADKIESAGDILVETIKRGNKILICGNGGSAADAQHFAAELVGRFMKNRMPLPAIALTTDTSILTAIGNDYGNQFIFARQLSCIGKSGDVLIAISTSGNSSNILHAKLVAVSKNIKVVGLSGGGVLSIQSDYPITVNHENTARIQECHELILHYWAKMIEDGIS